MKKFVSRRFFFSSSKTVDQKEINNFSNVSDWWESGGSMQALKAYNYLRVEYIKKILRSQNLLNNNNPRYPLQGLNLLDVGCGGGLLAESLTRLGGNVTGIDPTENSIRVASNHQKKDPDFLKNLKYIHVSPEQHVTTGVQYDIVTSVEVIEHVSNANDFVKNLSSFVKPNGLVFLSTFNKTIKSYIFSIVLAEYVSRVVPVGTHDWRKYISPQELIILCENHSLKKLDLQGASYHPLWNKMEFSSNVDINYLVSFKKN